MIGGIENHMCVVRLPRNHMVVIYSEVAVTMELNFIYVIMVSGA